MPSYEYKCSCGERLEVIHGMDEKAAPVCLKCGSKMRRDYNFGAIKFNGNGWGHQA